MTPLKRIKPYKKVDPAKTVSLIRDILDSCSLFTCEYPYPPTPESFYSGGVMISDEKVGGLRYGAFGKGLSAKYSMASAYAEFIERLQNNVLFFNRYALPFPVRCATRAYLDTENKSSNYEKKLESEGLVLDYMFGPDEETVSSEAAVRLFYPTLKHLFNEPSESELLSILKTRLKKDAVTGVPFYNVSEREVRFLPLELIYRSSVSTGMCSGNTPEEAIIHGICEVFERYAVKKIYADELTPPTIPIDLFSGTEIFDRLQKMMATGNQGIIIKDCSLGIGLPVIGVIVVDYRKNRYSFNLGSDPSPITALERCISEMYQGGSDIHFSELHFSSDPFDTGNGRSREQNKSDQYYDTLFRGTGAWPNSIFSERESYPFAGFDHSISESDDDDLEYLTEKIHELGFELYVRDVSFLGFPSYFVYIPGMSEGKYSYNADFLIAMAQIDKVLPALYDMKNATEGELASLADLLDRIYESSQSFDIVRTFLPNTSRFILGMPQEILIMMLYGRLGNYRKAYRYVDLYLEKQKTSGKPMPAFHLCLRDYFFLKQKETPVDRIESVLTNLYGASVCKSVVDEFKDPAALFNRSEFPSCFQCAECDIKSDCRHFDVLMHIKRIQSKCISSPIQQESLGALFFHVPEPVL